MAAQPRHRPVVLILAAGQGKRLRSKHIKLVHPVAFQPLVTHVAQAARKLKPQAIYAVVGHQAEAVKGVLQDHVDGFALQAERKGTGHAVLMAKKLLNKHPKADLLILNGDVPTLRPETLRKLLNGHRRAKAALSVLSAKLPDATGYGRIIRDQKGNFERIVEHTDASPAERAVKEINSGLYCVNTAKLLKVLSKIKPNNKQGEYYITDAVHALRKQNEPVIAVVAEDAAELLGVNDRKELTAASRTLFDRKNEALQKAGVTLYDASRTYIDPRAKIAKDVEIWPDVIIEGSTAVGEDSILRSGSRIVDSKIGRGVEIKDHCVVMESTIGNGSAIGPFAHLRPGTDLKQDVKIGNFVETKKAKLAKGAKASHLSYLGDVEVGEESNIGAGTITCNYDGENKHQTKLGKRVFIGSDSQLVAPVTLADDSYVGAGSTITKDVPKDTLAISRGRQSHILNWSERKAKKSKAAKPKATSKSRAKKKS